MHFANRGDTAHTAVMEQQRALAESLFDTDLAINDAEQLRWHGLLFSKEFVRGVWVDNHGAQAVAQRAQRLRCQRISKKVRGMRLRHTDEWRRRMSERRRGRSTWNTGLGEWLRTRMLSVASERLGEEELGRLRGLFANRSEVVAKRGCSEKGD